MFAAALTSFPRSVQEKYSSAAQLRSATTHYLRRHYDAIRDSYGPNAEVFERAFVDIERPDAVMSDKGAVALNGLARMLDVYIIVVPEDGTDEHYFEFGNEDHSAVTLLLRDAFGGFYLGTRPIQHSRDVSMPEVAPSSTDHRRDIAAESALPLRTSAPGPQRGPDGDGGSRGSGVDPDGDVGGAGRDVAVRDVGDGDGIVSGGIFGHDESLHGPTAAQNRSARDLGLVPVRVMPTGNCMYDAFLKSEPAFSRRYPNAIALRQDVARYMRENYEYFRDYFVGSPEEYYAAVQHLHDTADYMTEISNLAYEALAQLTESHIRIMPEDGSMLEAREFGRRDDPEVVLLRRETAGGHLLGTKRVPAGRHDSISAGDHDGQDSGRPPDEAESAVQPVRAARPLAPAPRRVVQADVMPDERALAYEPTADGLGPRNYREYLETRSLPAGMSLPSRAVKDWADLGPVEGVDSAVGNAALRANRSVDWNPLHFRSGQQSVRAPDHEKNGPIRVGGNPICGATG